MSRKKKESIKIPVQVLEGIEFVRCAGLTNMFIIKAVQKIASDNDYYATVLWIEDNKQDYIRGLMQGFQVDLLESLAEEG